MVVRSLLLVLCLTACLYADDADKDRIVRQQEELQKIQKDLQRGQQVLDSLKNEEARVQNNVAEFDQRIASNKKTVSRLNQQLESVRRQKEAADSALARQQGEYERVRRRLLGNLRQFYLTSRQQGGASSTDPNEELCLQRRIVYLTALAAFESGSVAQASQLLGQAVSGLENLTGEQKKVVDLVKKRQTASALDQSKRALQQKALTQLQRRKTEQADELLTLQRAAEEMAAIVARLEQKRQESPESPGVSDGALFAALKGTLVSPVAGKIITPFGAAVDSVTKLKSFSPGIVIGCRPGTAVKAVAAGRVAYVGELRGYGNFVILDHGGNYFTTYAGLEQVIVSAGRLARTGEELAQAGAEGKIRFELRQGRKALDPTEWLRFDSF